MSPTLIEVEEDYQTTLEIGDLVKDQRGYFDQVTKVELQVENKGLAKLIFGQNSPAVELEEIDITGPQKHKRVVAKSGPNADVNFIEIVKSVDRTDPWSPKKTEV